MAGYEEEDYNPLYDLWSCLSEARDHIWYALKDDDHPGGMVV